jgi:dCTP deaminase
MTLTGHRIRKLVERGNIAVVPHPGPEQYQPASLDLRLGDEMYEMDGATMLEPEDGTFSLYPGTFYLGTTKETVSIPDDLVGHLAGRSTFAREGLVTHLVAGWCDPGFHGELTLEMLNVGHRPIEVDVGERVVQLAFNEMVGEKMAYEGNYSGQDGPTLSARGDGGE